MTRSLTKPELDILIDQESERAKTEGAHKRLISHLKALVNNRDPLKSLTDYLEVAKPKGPTIILDHEYKIHYMSHKACTLLDYKRVEGLDLLNKPYIELISDPNEKVIFETKIKTKEPFSQKLLLKKKKGLTRVESRVTNYLSIRDYLVGVVIEVNRALFF